MRTRILTAVLAGFVAGLALAASAEANRSLYVSGFNSWKVAAFGFTPVGGLSQIAGSPYSAAINASAMAMTPDGRYLYVGGSGTSGPGEVTAHAVAANGTLTPVAGSPFTSPSPRGLVLSADGQFLYVANTGAADAVSAFAIAAGGSLAPLQIVPSGDNPNALALTPDGRHLYSANAGAAGNNISVYDIAGNGTLSPGPGSPVPAGTSPRGAAVTPDGKYLYVSNQGSTNIYAFSIASNGALSPVAGTPFTGGTSQFDIAITPDGRHLYVASNGDDSVHAFDIGANGALTSIAGSPFGNAGDGPIGLALTPGATRLYVSAQAGTVAEFRVAANGALIPVLGSPFPAGVTDPDLESVAITPNQAPSASIAAKAAAPGSTTQFDGSASTDPDGTVQSFLWDFGDGTSMTSTATAITTHSYLKAGIYKPKVTVTDNDGCSTVQVFTGRAVSCNGGPTAIATTTLDTPPAISGLGVTNKRFAIASARTKRVKRGTKFRYRLSEAARVTFTIGRKTVGRRVGKSCRKLTRTNRKRRKCIRYPTVGAFGSNAKAGLNRTAFSGRSRGRKLAQGSYKATAIAIDSAGARSRPRSVTFKIVKSR